MEEKNIVARTPEEIESICYYRTGYLINKVTLEALEKMDCKGLDKESADIAIQNAKDWMAHYEDMLSAYDIKMEKVIEMDYMYQVIVKEEK